MLQRVDHIAIAVMSIDASLPLYRDALGMRLVERETVADQMVHTAVLLAGSQRIELVEPAAPDSPVSKFLEKRGEGIHHVAYAVDDIHAAIAHCQAKGLRMIDEQPRIGAGGAQIAFLHPKSTGGVLTELTQRPTAPRHPA